MYLFPFVCVFLTVKHVLLECVEYDFFRPSYLGNHATLKAVFDNVSADACISFMKKKSHF